MNYEQMANNRLHLCGTIISEPVFSHEIYGEGFYEMFLSVERLSEQKDILPITISERLIDEYEIKIGSKICFNGQFRSYNKLENGRSRLMLTVFVRDIEELNESKNPNLIYLAGYICKPTVYRTTPFSREICDVLLAINRAYNKSDYIPCIAWGRNARFLKNMNVGDKVSITGRIQSRTYQKRCEDRVEERVAYEVSISKIALGENQELLGELGDRAFSQAAAADETREHDIAPGSSDEFRYSNTES